MRLEANRRFWDAKTKENPYWYVSSYGPYKERDLDGFWASGLKIWRDLKTTLGYRPKPTDVVVEIGCGVGRLTRAIAPEVGHVHALDISEQMLTMAREFSAPNVTFHHTDGEGLRPLPDSFADLMLAYCVFQHLPSEQILAGYFKEMARVARPGALLAFTLTPRTWHVYVRPLIQARRWLKEWALPDGPRDLYRHEWLGIRPTAATVQHLSPVPLTQGVLHGDKWLFYGRTPERTARD